VRALKKVYLRKLGGILGPFLGLLLVLAIFSLMPEISGRFAAGQF